MLLGWLKNVLINITSDFNSFESNYCFFFILREKKSCTSLIRECWIKIIKMLNYFKYIFYLFRLYCLYQDMFECVTLCAICSYKMSSFTLFIFSHRILLFIYFFTYMTKDGISYNCIIWIDVPKQVYFVDPDNNKKKEWST